VLLVLIASISNDDHNISNSLPLTQVVYHGLPAMTCMWWRRRTQMGLMDPTKAYNIHKLRS